MKKIEGVFCIGYLLFAFTASTIFFTRSDLPCAIMTLLLASGDAFHLIPRIIKDMVASPYDDKLQWWLGLGNLISSITMTLFYVALVVVMDKGQMPAAVMPLVICLAAIRILLCFAPGNNWFGDGGNQQWRLYRNLPFLGIGIVTVLYLILIYDKWLLALLVIVSFACYMAVVMGAKKNPKLGMLMIPKTICYIWMIAWFLNNR